MKTLILAAIRCFLLFLIPTVTYAISTQWAMDPISGDWNTVDNWTNGVPNGPADTATFGLSNTTDISISKDTVVDGISFTPAAGPYTVTASPGIFLTLSGTGIMNNSGPIQNFVTAGEEGDIHSGGRIEFTNNATAGIDTRFTNNASEDINAFVGGLTIFGDSSKAGNGTFVNNGATTIAGHGGATIFGGDSHADSGTFVNDGGMAAGATGGSTRFQGNSHADSATLSALGGSNGGEGGTILFQGNSHADSATLIADGGTIFFQGNSDGGTTIAGHGGATVKVLGNGLLDLSNHDSGIFSIGSIEGEGIVDTGDAELSLFIGSNDRNTTFSGVMSALSAIDLHKVGTGRLTLSGKKNQIGGDTDIDGGVLQVDGTLKSGNTFVFERGTLAGSGTVGSDVVADGTVRPGSGEVPGALTISGGYSQGKFATLMIQIAGAGADDYSTLHVRGSAGLNGILELVLLKGFIPTVDDTFTFLFYHDHFGKFSSIANENFAPGLKWELTDDDYGPSFVTLRVVPASLPIPDQGPTLLLLTFGLLGLMTFRRQLSQDLNSRRIS